MESCLLICVLFLSITTVTRSQTATSLVTFSTDDALSQMITIISATSGARTPSSGPSYGLETNSTANATAFAPQPAGMELIALSLTAPSDPLTDALNEYLSPALFLEATASVITGGVELVPNATSTLASQPQNQRLLQLSDGLHSWLANSSNLEAIQTAVQGNASFADIEELQGLNSSDKCDKLEAYSDNVVTSNTKAYCCDNSGFLPDGSLAIVCNARIHQDVSAFMSLPSTTQVTSSVAQGQQTVVPIAQGSRRKSRRKLAQSDDAGDSLPCSATDLGNLQKGILPKVSCCFTVAPDLDLCLKVSGQVEVVDFVSGSNDITIYQGSVPTAYCSSLHIDSSDQLAAASCTNAAFTQQTFINTAESAFIDVQATLCLTGGEVIDFLADNLGFDANNLCFVHLEIKYFEAMQTLAFFLDVGADIGSIFDFDLVVEGEVQLAYHPPLCEFILENYNPAPYPWCELLETHGCWWHPGDSNLEFTVSLQAIGLIDR